MKEVAGGRQLRLEGCVGKQEDNEKSKMPRNWDFGKSRSKASRRKGRSKGGGSCME